MRKASEQPTEVHLDIFLTIEETDQLIEILDDQISSGSERLDDTAISLLSLLREAKAFRQ